MSTETLEETTSSSTTTTTSTPWYKRLWNWFCGKVVALFTVTAKGVAAGVIEFINDADNQALAKSLISEAKTQGLTGSEAFAYVLNGLKATFGDTIKDNVLESLAQLTYTIDKNTTSSES